MKRRNEPAPSPLAAAETKRRAALPPWTAVAFAPALLLGMTVQTPAVSLGLMALGTAAAVWGAVCRRPGGRGQTAAAAGLLALCIVRGAGAIYSPFDETALAEYCRFAAAAALAATALCLFRREHVRWLLWDLAGVSAAISWLSADLAAGAALFARFNAVTTALGADLSYLLAGAGAVRVNGFYNDSNVTAALFALGAILGLYLLRSSPRPAGRLGAAVLAGANLVGLVISGSRGGMLCFAAACLLYLLAQRKDRLGLFLLLIQAAAVTPLCALWCNRYLTQQRPAALWALPLCGVALFALDALFTRPLSALMRKRPRAAAILGGAVAAVAVAASALLLSADGPVTFTEQDPFWYRSLQQAPGTYALSGDWTGDLQALVYCRSPLDVYRNTSTTLYSGPLSQCAYTVPEDTAEVILRLTGAPGEVLRRLTLPGGKDLRLSYRLLPRAIGSRLLGENLTGSVSFLYRLAFDRDAWTLFTQAPLLGHGLGSTEHLYRSVQTFSYESKYAHNHVLQTLSDTGMAGLLAAALFALGSAWACLRALREDGDGPWAAVLAAWGMMHLHSLMEINFSVQGFACFAYVVMALPLVAQDAPPPAPVGPKWRRYAAAALPVAFGAYFAVFGALIVRHDLAERTARETGYPNAEAMLQGLERLIRQDVFTPSQYQLTFAANAVLLQNSRYNGTMFRCVEALESTGVYENCSGLAQYYYLPRQEWEKLFAVSRRGIRQVRSSPDGWNLQMDFYRCEVLPAMGAENMEAFLDGALALAADLDAMNAEGRLEEVSFTPENQAFVSLCRQLRDEGWAAETAFAQLTAAATAPEEAPPA